MRSSYLFKTVPLFVYDGEIWFRWTPPPCKIIQADKNTRIEIIRKHFRLEMSTFWVALFIFPFLFPASHQKKVALEIPMPGGYTYFWSRPPNRSCKLQKKVLRCPCTTSTQTSTIARCSTSPDLILTVFTLWARQDQCQSR